MTVASMSTAGRGSRAVIPGVYDWCNAAVVKPADQNEPAENISVKNRSLRAWFPTATGRCITRVTLQSRERPLTPVVMPVVAMMPVVVMTIMPMMAVVSVMAIVGLLDEA